MGYTNNYKKNNENLILRNRSCLKLIKQNLPISSGTTQHFVDSDNMEWMASDPHVESIFTTGFDHVSV